MLRGHRSSFNCVSAGRRRPLIHRRADPDRSSWRQQMRTAIRFRQIRGANLLVSRIAFITNGRERDSRANVVIFGVINFAFDDPVTIVRVTFATSGATLFGIGARAVPVTFVSLIAIAATNNLAVPPVNEDSFACASLTKIHWTGSLSVFNRL